MLLQLLLQLRQAFLTGLLFFVVLLLLLLLYDRRSGVGNCLYLALCVEGMEEGVQFLIQDCTLVGTEDSEDGQLAEM